MARTSAFPWNSLYCIGQHQVFNQVCFAEHTLSLRIGCFIHHYYSLTYPTITAAFSQFTVFFHIFLKTYYHTFLLLDWKKFFAISSHMNFLSTTSDSEIGFGLYNKCCFFWLRVLLLAICDSLSILLCFVLHHFSLRQWGMVVDGHKSPFTPDILIVKSNNMSPVELVEDI